VPAAPAAAAAPAPTAPTAAPAAPAAPPATADPANDDPDKLVDRARTARRKGHLVAPAGTSAVDLLLAATSAGATGAAVNTERDKLLRDLVKDARHAQRGRKWGRARDAWAAVLKLRPGDDAATKGLAEATKKAK
jgi:3-oxoacyl-ACP reductase-like protein